MSTVILRTEIRTEQDIVLARQRARQIGRLLGLEPQSQTRLATAVSEVARNAWQYAGGGQALFQLTRPPAPELTIVIADQGPGIADLDAVLEGRYRSPSGLGLGLTGARRLCDSFHIETRAGAGTTVTLGKALPAGAPFTPARLAEISRELTLLGRPDMTGESRMQEQELLRTLEEIRERQSEVERLNLELAETNRGVLALYAELDERAQELARASELKSRFLSNISHELRTPLNAILNITRLLAEQVDGPLTTEQERQVRFVRTAAASLSEMVNDLLDLARIEAGRTLVRPATFTVQDLFGALRGMFRPLATTDAVALIFEDPGPVTLTTDEGKLSQILRNFVSNALKFTERGEVRVTVAREPDDMVCFTVADTGIGIAPEDQERVFEEFSQLDSPLQRRATGTGLGLPLSRKLAEVLGGSVSLSSAPGEGSSFQVRIPETSAVPRTHPAPGPAAMEAEHV
jgi:signal transduction histidine kinase